MLNYSTEINWPQKLVLRDPTMRVMVKLTLKPKSNKNSPTCASPQAKADLSSGRSNWTYNAVSKLHSISNLC